MKEKIINPIIITIQRLRALLFGINILRCEKETEKLLQLFESNAPRAKLEKSTMAVLEYLWNQSNFLYDLVQKAPKAGGRSGRDYFDGVRLGELAYKIALRLREYGAKSAEEIALNVRLKAILQVQAHYHHIIGPAMLEHTEVLMELGRTLEASENYLAIIEDFSFLLDEYEEEDEEASEEDIVSITSLLTALTKYVEINNLSNEETRQMEIKINKANKIISRV